MNPYINAIMGHSGSMALDAELDYILGEDLFEEGEGETEGGESEGGETEGKGETEGEDFFDEGESEEEGESEGESDKAKAKAAKAKLLKKLKRKKGKKRVKRSYTKRELKVIKSLKARIKKKLSGKRTNAKKRAADRMKRRIQKIRDRARRRWLKKNQKGSKNEMIHMANPFALKESAVIRGMAQPEQDTYIRNKSISSGVFLGALAAGFYTFWKREESAEYVLQDGSVMSKDDYYENEEYLPSRHSHTEKGSWKDSFMEDPKMTGGIFAAATAIGTFWANSNLKRRLKEE